MNVALTAVRGLLLSESWPEVAGAPAVRLADDDDGDELTGV